MLIGTNRKSQTYYWDNPDISVGIGPDNPKNHKKYMKTFGKGWYYYNSKDISYVHNSHGFREKELDEVDWSNSIVVLGCSMVWGCGNAIEDTIPYILQETLGIPTVNLGVSGAGPDLLTYNSLFLHNHYPRPKAIVQMWSGMARYMELDPYKGNRFTVPSHRDYCINHDWEWKNKLLVELERTVWEDKVPRYECSFFKDTSEKLNIDHLEWVDDSRDQYHPGYMSNQSAAKTIAQNLLKQGVKK